MPGFLQRGGFLDRTARQAGESAHELERQLHAINELKTGTVGTYHAAKDKISEQWAKWKTEHRGELDRVGQQGERLLQDLRDTLVKTHHQGVDAVRKVVKDWKHAHGAELNRAPLEVQAPLRRMEQAALADAKTFNKR